MLFSLKNPLKRHLSPRQIQQSREKNTQEGAFLGASLLDKKAFILALDAKSIVRITGNAATYAPDSAIRMIRQAIEEKRSVLMIDLINGPEEFWHRFWAVTFYLDHAKDFRLIDLCNAKHSDVLGPNIPQNIEGLPKYLKDSKKPTDIRKHLSEKGLVALTAHHETEKEKVRSRQLLCQLCFAWQNQADFLVIFGWENLSHDQQRDLIKQRQDKSPDSPHLAVFQNHFEKEGSDQNFLHGTKEVVFRQRNSLPNSIFKEIQNLSKKGPLAKIIDQLNEELSSLDDPQCLVIERGEEKEIDLVQTNTGDGLPWPPDYRPLRSRFE